MWTHCYSNFFGHTDDTDKTDKKRIYAPSEHSGFIKTPTCMRTSRIYPISDATHQKESFYIRLISVIRVPNLLVHTKASGGVGKFSKFMDHVG